MSDIEKTKVLIHELMHIPKTFGGGFKHHDYVCRENVELEYERYINLKKPKIETNNFKTETNNQINKSNQINKRTWW